MEQIENERMRQYYIIGGIFFKKMFWQKQEGISDITGLKYIILQEIFYCDGYTLEKNRVGRTGGFCTVL